MVEKSHTSGLWPSIYDPFRNIGSKVSEWLAPASEASTNDDAYVIGVELPGVEEGDIDLSVNDGVVSLKGEKRRHARSKVRLGILANGSTGHFHAVSGCRPMPTKITSQQTSRTAC